MAAHYGKLLKALRLLTKGDVIAKTASDFVGSAVGESQKKTQAILALAEGCVLLIDEAYVLDDQLYGKQVLDTIVEKVLGTPGEDIAVVLIGYERQISKMIFDQNPGLTRCFDLTYALRFVDYTDNELMQIFSNVCRAEKVKASVDVKCAAVKQLSKQRSMKNFGNAGAVNNLLSDALKRLLLRQKNDKSAEKDRLTVEDVSGNRSRFEGDPFEIFKDLEGDSSDSGYTSMLNNIRDQILVRKKEGSSLVGVVENFIFFGASGVGKTAVARKMSQMLYAFGLLGSDKVVETSGLGLTGQYLGQTKKVVEEQMEAARGGILLIDEFYEMGGGYAKEAIAQLLAMMTFDDYKDGKTIVILAGYTKQMQDMLDINEGLKSRFEPTGHVNFEDWSPNKCIKVVLSLASKGDVKFQPLAMNVENALRDGFEKLSTDDNYKKGWANARDAESMFKTLKKSRDQRIAKLMKEGGYSALDDVAKTTITIEDAERAVGILLKSRKVNIDPVPPSPTKVPVNPQLADLLMSFLGGGGGIPPPPPGGEERFKMREGFDADNYPEMTQNQHVLHSSRPAAAAGLGLAKPEDPREAAAEIRAEDCRACACHAPVAEVNSDVIDQADANEQQRLKEIHEQDLNRQEAERKRLLDEEIERERRAKEESERIEREIADAKAKDEALAKLNAELEKQRAEAEVRQREQLKLLVEARKRDLLRAVSNCPAGFSWIKTGGGWACTGGSHKVSDAELERCYTQTYNR